MAEETWRGTVTNEDGSTEQVEVKASDVKTDDRMRILLSDTYVFVRSQALNRVVAGYTLDHYLVQAQQAIGTRILTNADGEETARRPSRLELLATLESAFNSLYPVALKKAQRADEQASKEDSDG